MQFNERYKIYLDWTVNSDWDWNNDTDANWVEIFPDISPFENSLENNQLFKRWKWNEVTIRNNPNKSGDAYELYDIISGLEVDQEIRIKLTTDNNTIRGYFGVNDCEFDSDNKVLTIIPTTLDQYSEVLENMENDVNVIHYGVVTTGRLQLDSSIAGDLFADSHNIPLDIVSSNIDEISDPNQTADPNNGGAFLSNTKYKYVAEIKINMLASSPIGTSTIGYIKLVEYDSSNVELQSEILKEVEQGTTISENFTVNWTLSKNSYLVLEFEKIISGGRISYTTVDVYISLKSIESDTLSIDVNILSNRLAIEPVWTYKVHGRESPEQSDWADTNGVSDYFNIDGSPKLELFSDPEFGPVAPSGAIFGNGYDILNEPISDLYLGEIITLLDDYDYEPYEVTVWEGKTKYFDWHKRRKVYSTCQFAREEIWYVTGEDPNDSGEGTGWNMSSIAPVGGKTLWTRKPFNGAYSDSWNLGDVDTSGGFNSEFEWESKLQSVKAYPNGDNTRTFNSVIDFKTLVETIYNGTSDKLSDKNVYSTFFWNDNEGDLSFYDSNPSGSNYVTIETTNILNRLGCIHTADFDTNGTGQDKTDQEFEISLTKLIDDLKKLFPIYWFVDSDSNLHIEHIKYMDMILYSEDVTDEPLIDETLKWNFDKGNLFSQVTYEMANSGYKNFANGIIEFKKIPSNKRNKDISLDYKTEIITTDILYCVENQTELENGFALIAYDENNVMINSVGKATNTLVENGNMSLANLLVDYWRYEGVFSSGKINDVTYEFTTTSRNKIGKEISLKNVYDINASDNEIIALKTNIGIGLIKNMKIDFERGITTDIVLVYRYNSTPDGNLFQLICATDVLYDFGNYEN